MRYYESSATIDAGPDAIWTVLTDAPAYAAWDSGVDKVEGTIAPGETIKVGPLLPMIWRTMPDLGPSFEQFARGLKARAEERGG
jgi:hypothetical protein